ncbi:MAG: oxidoreductase [Planctomycetaceae bacterium]|nr:oxidoreductase [Planctomycetaceae bacterium]
MSARPNDRCRCAVLSVVKHAYVPNGVASHPRFELVVVADDADQPDWVHERNQLYADQNDIPYVRDVEKAIRDFDVQVGVVSSEAERHCDLSVRAANAGLHVVQDKPMSISVSECDRLVEAVVCNNVKFLMWNRNFLPALIHAHQAVTDGTIGQLFAIHVDFYFAKDSGPQKGSRQPGDPPINWLERQIEAHADGSDGGVGCEPMGELQIEGIYPLAYIRMLTGVDVKRVFARTTAHFHQANVDNDVDDLATVTLEMDGGVTGSLCIGRIGAASHPDIGEIKVHMLGSEGALVISEARPEVSIHYRGQPATEFRNRRVGIDNDYLLMDDLANAIDNARPTILDAIAGRAITATVAAAVESGKSAEVVEVC